MKKPEVYFEPSSWGIPFYYYKASSVTTFQIFCFMFVWWHSDWEIKEDKK